MKHTLQGLIVTASLLTGGFALAQSGMANQPTKNEKGTTELKGFMAPTDEKALLERLHHVNQQEVKLGQLAEKNAMSEDVKSFASMMVKDHGAMDQKLMDYAKSKNLKLSDTPTAMNDAEKKMMARDKANMDLLQTLKSSAFDSSYTVTMVGGHDATLGMLMAAKKGMPGATPQLTTMLDETTQKVSAHREQAYTILGKLGTAMGVGGSGMGNMEHGNMEHGSMGHGATKGGSTAPTTPSPQK
ncbi:DUF4142 domain-containing protein [Pyxidicoccus parkwayensis]|jgi:putative membrane protein|uniref:DUF4142 domain-containing protein n=1 Tax=Pyxidicoccus parkwayensis TaxID=2813578 RepID=A0ABX7NWF3_9BACT|nr:DUF4142 domain-containing protein [Pyxidicoccus parkwaysis]QSQ22689.1 DUF4142 domain-containing protein [Pyxidicoccus parkwaysis]